MEPALTDIDMRSTVGAALRRSGSKRGAAGLATSAIGRSIESAAGREIVTPREKPGTCVAKELRGQGHSQQAAPFYQSVRFAIEEDAPPVDQAVRLGSKASWASDTFRSPSIGRSTRSSPAVEHKSAKPRFDALTIREWYNAMDVEMCGHVTKLQFFDSMRKNPDLLKFILGECSEAEMKHMRTMVKAFHAIDTNKNGTLEWDEFLESFRSNGHLFEYSEQTNPKQRMAEILARLHDHRDQDVDELDEFVALKSKHLTGERRKRLGAVEAKVALQKIEQELDKAGEQQPILDRRRQSLGRLCAPALGLELDPVLAEGRRH